MKQAQNMKKPAMIAVAATVGYMGLFGYPITAQADSSFAEAIVGYLIGSGKASGDFRLRNETVSQDNPSFTDDASALTFRSRLGYKTAIYKGFDAFLEFENVAVYDTEAYFTAAKATNDKPVIVDPESTEVNQKWLGFSAIPKTVIRYGRQKIIYDNARFIGNVGFRQNEQTFDGATLVSKYIQDTTFSLAFIHNVNRITGESAPDGDFDMQSTFANVNYEGFKIGKISAYNYVIDYNAEPTNTSQPKNSTSTTGARFAGGYKMNDDVEVVYAAEYAQQSDAGDNAVETDVSYILLEPGVTFKGVTGVLGYETLGSDDGKVAFQTPLATLHLFNGWADMWLVTPVKGLVDQYISVTTLPMTPLGLKFGANYHMYESDQDGDDYGSEIGALIAKPIGENSALTFKYANYSASDEAEALKKFDTTKMWLTAETKF